MGLHPDWKRALHARAPGAFVAGRGPPPCDLVVADGNLMLFARPDWVRTGRDLAAWFAESADEALLATGARAYVLAFDDPSLVPAEKAATQARRARQGPPPLPDELAEAHGAGDGPLPDWAWAGVLANRPYRARLVRRLVRALEDYYEPPPGRSFAVDHPAARRDRSMVSAVGEGDLKLAEAVRALRPRSVLLDSVDSDMIPIAMLLAQELPGTRIHLTTLPTAYIEGSKGAGRRVYVDVRRLLDEISRLTGLGARALAAALALAGTDFFPSALPGVGPAGILDRLAAADAASERFPGDPPLDDPAEAVARALAPPTQRGARRGKAGPPPEGSVEGALWVARYWRGGRDAPPNPPSAMEA